jgi:uncharacterized protein HemX
MWYAIIGGAGLAVGLGLLIWGLRERRKRHEAERAADEARRKEAEAAALADANAGAAKNLQGQLDRMELQVEYQRKRLSEARKLLAEKAPLKTIKEWLDEEGQGGEI